MEKTEKTIVVDPEGVCLYFDRGAWSLPEEMDACDVCNHYVEEGSRCRCPQRVAMEEA
ncbi:MAG: hypothetical protein ACI4PC_04205 [Oscillospiraceae bacterium]